MTHDEVRSSNPAPELLTGSKLVGIRVKQLRKQRGFTAADLAKRCATLGAPEVTRNVVANVESGRRDVSVDKLLALALALDAAPIDLLTWPGGGAGLAITASVSVESNEALAHWILGAAPLPESDPVAFATGAVHRSASSALQEGADSLLRQVITQQVLSETADRATERLEATTRHIRGAITDLRNAVGRGADTAELTVLIDAAERHLSVRA